MMEAGRSREGKQGGTRTLHTFPMAGGGIRTVSSTDEKRDQSKSVGERQRKKTRDKERRREKGGGGEREIELL